MEIQRLETMNERIAGLEAGIQRLKEQGQPTVEAERLLYLLRQSRGTRRSATRMLVIGHAH